MKAWKMVSVTALPALLSCGGLGSGVGVVTCSSTTDESCDFSNIGQCQAHTGTVTGFQLECASPNTYAKAPCPTAGRVGGCAAGSVLFSYYAPLTTASAKMSCTQGGGTWCP